MQPKWDTTLGLKMYQEGQSDKEIANHFGISVSTVSYQRRKFWEVTEDCPPQRRSGICVFPGGSEGGWLAGLRSELCRAAA